MIIDDLIRQGVLKIGAELPRWLPANTHFLVTVGSNAYGASQDESDHDIYGFCVPPKEMVFSHLAGHIFGFGSEPERFEQWQRHHVATPDGKKEYDFSVYGIVKFFNLVMNNNPNMISALFVPRECVLHATEIGNMVRDARRLFLHKGSFHKFRGYAASNIAKVRSQSTKSNPKRAELIRRFGFDTKAAMHVVRLALECEQILLTGDLDLQRDKEILKAVRRGDWTIEKIETWFADKDRYLEGLYETSTIPYEPDQARIKQLLLNCLEHHYGSLKEAVTVNVSNDAMIRDLEAVLDRYRT